MNDENLMDQTNQITDNAKNYASSVLHEGAEGVKNFANKAEKNINKAMGQDSCQHIVTSIDKQVRENPWAAVLGVAVGSLMLGFLVENSRKD